MPLVAALFALPLAGQAAAGFKLAPLPGSGPLAGIAHTAARQGPGPGAPADGGAADLTAPAGGEGRYLAGDFHNHSTFSDGSTSARTLIEYAVKTYGLDWFAQSGHGGRWSRDGRYDDPNFDGSDTEPGRYWVETVGRAGLKGDSAGTDSRGRPQMWKWQIIQEYLYPITFQASRDFGKPIWTGLEWNVPGHEHGSAAILTGQFPPGGMTGNADALAQFEYLFDMKDNDTSGGGGQGWRGKIPNPPKHGPGVGAAGHAKAVAAATWMQEHHRYTSYLVPAHSERKGVWNPNRGGNTGYNVEHFRDLNNAAPDVCFGFEGQPGHQAKKERGGFGAGAVGGGTFGGTGYYTAKIGHIWDALLGEGRCWWLFASSDWHSRDTAAFNQNLDLNHRKSNYDFWPGEYQKNYVLVKNGGPPTAQEVLDGLRRGNSFIVMGDLINGLEFTARGLTGRPAGMGETLKVPHGATVTLTVRVRDPEGPNHCPYTFPNPSLAQVGIHQPLHLPELHHVDLIGGKVTGKIAPTDANYTNPHHPSAAITKTVLAREMQAAPGGWKGFTYTFTAFESCYFRLRGANLPANVPYETDAQGNPLSDTLAGRIKYTHPTLGPNTALDTDVEAWSDLWFYSNPIFVQVVP